MEYGSYLSTRDIAFYLSKVHEGHEKEWWQTMAPERMLSIMIEAKELGVVKGTEYESKFEEVFDKLLSQVLSEYAKKTA
ncbi:MAG: hypothetical protein KatS3mg031_2906 [Chitinophagales bacterium]|nr:MAG: hypothetical protein KatS3mg031_2906 [Chitinophagales bacterium]